MPLVMKYWPAIKWWELRRIFFNLVIFLSGLCTIFIVYGVAAPHVKPGEDMVEPFLLYVLMAIYAAVANFFYTLGWVSEILWSAGDIDYTAVSR